MVDLDYYLGALYASDLLGKGNHEEVKRIFKSKLAKGSRMEQLARKRIGELEQVEGRCFISRKHLEYLRNAL